mgnify:CR=1 FL=1
MSTSLITPVTANQVVTCFFNFKEALEATQKEEGALKKLVENVFGIRHPTSRNMAIVTILIHAFKISPAEVEAELYRTANISDKMEESGAMDALEEKAYAASRENEDLTPSEKAAIFANGVIEFMNRAQMTP